MSRGWLWRAAALTLALCAGAASAQTVTARGAADAPVTIMVFSGFACKYCAESRATLEQIEAEYPGKIRLIYKHFPLGEDRAAYLPHMAAQAAAEQGKFWAMHGALFAHQAQLGERERIDALARSLGLDMARFAAALEGPAGRERIAADVSEARALKVQATPTFYVDGYKFEGAQSAAVFRTMIDHVLAPRTPSSNVSNWIDQARRQPPSAIEAQLNKGKRQ